MNKIDTLKKRLFENNPLIMDGGMGSEIQHKGFQTTLPLWSADILLTHPEIVQKIHEEYIRSGAEIIITNTFRTTKRAFSKKGISGKAKKITYLACEVAKQAIKTVHPSHEVYIAGSIAPLEECYAPERTPPDKELHSEMNELVANLQKGGVDFILFETMITLRETLAGIRAAKRHKIPFAVSFCCNEKMELLGGEPVSQVITHIEKYKPLFLGVNCISPEIATKLVHHIRQLTKFPICVYAQGDGETDKTQGWKITEEKNKKAYVQSAKEWVADGAQIIGGCCGTTPEYIYELHTVLNLR